ncbi:hypothetical protein LCGC14_2965840, partial [marine sediment metagenome]
GHLCPLRGIALFQFCTHVDIPLGFVFELALEDADAARQRP